MVSISNRFRQIRFLEIERSTAQRNFVFCLSFYFLSSYVFAFFSYQFLSRCSKRMKKDTNAPFNYVMLRCVLPIFLSIPQFREVFLCCQSDENNFLWRIMLEPDEAQVEKRELIEVWAECERAIKSGNEECTVQTKCEGACSGWKCPLYES